MKRREKVIRFTRLIRLGVVACFSLNYNVCPAAHQCQGCSATFNPQPFWRTEEELATVCNESNDCIDTAVIYQPNHLAFLEARVHMVQGFAEDPEPFL